MDPVLRVVRGTPDDAELAAVTAVLLALAAKQTVRQQSIQPAASWTRVGPYTAPGAWIS